MPKMKIFNFLKKLVSSSIFWPLFFLFLVLAFNFFFNSKTFFHIEIKEGHLYGSIIDIINRAAPLMLVSIGMTLVIATTGIDISVGAIVAISGAIAAKLIGGTLVLKGGVQEYVTLVPMPVAIITAILISTILGLWNGMLVSRVGIQPIVATLILMVAGRGIAQLITRGQIITIYYKPYFIIGNGFLFMLPFTLFIVLTVLILSLFLTRRTAIGLFIESVGTNATATKYSGINSQNIILLIYAFCGFCCGIAGLIVSSNVKSADGNNAGLLLELDAILAVAIGGTSMTGGRFFLSGSIIGALLIQSLTTSIYSIGVPPEITLVVKAIVVLIVCLIQSETFRKKIFGIGLKGAL